MFVMSPIYQAVNTLLIKNNHKKYTAYAIAIFMPPRKYVLL